MKPRLCCGSGHETELCGAAARPPCVLQVVIRLTVTTRSIDSREDERRCSLCLAAALTLTLSLHTDPSMMESMPVSYASTMGGMMGHYFSGGSAAMGVGQIPPTHHSNPHVQQPPPQQPAAQQESGHAHQQASHTPHAPAQSTPEVSTRSQP